MAFNALVVIYGIWSLYIILQTLGLNPKHVSTASNTR